MQTQAAVPSDRPETTHAKGVAIADLNADTYKTSSSDGGGNEHVYALNGRNGPNSWQFGTDDPEVFRLVTLRALMLQLIFRATAFLMSLQPEVHGTGGVGGRRSVYLFNGATGAIRWMSPLPGFTHAVTAIGDISATVSRM